MRDVKLPQVRLEPAWLLTTKHKFVCFNVTSRTDIGSARSSFCQAHYLSRESIRTEIRGSWFPFLRQTDLHLELENLSTTLNIMCIT